MSQSISLWKQEAQLLVRDHAMRNVNPNPNPNHNPNWSQNCAVTVVYLTDLVTSLDIENQSGCR